MKRLPWVRTCRDVTVLLVAREDRDLKLAERWALRLHLPLCMACQRMQGQVLTIRHALQKWRQDSETPTPP